MEVIFGLQSRKKSEENCVLTIGNFDGMHIGHQALLKRVSEVSKAKELQGGLLTFDPHPLKVLFPEKNTKTIFPVAEKIEMAKGLGLDFFIVEPFSRELSELPPEVFFESLLVKALKVKFLIVGYDFNFGKNRAGTHEVLKSLCEKFNVNLEILPPVKVRDEIVSSTKIREAIAQSDLEKANLFLGYPFFITGLVEKGAGRGHKIGFPTANLFTTADLIPKKGVYVTSVSIGGKEFPSVTNVGDNPTFKEANKREIQIETHVLDFKDDIYGEKVKLTFIQFLRPEMKFNSVDELIKNIQNDILKARAIHWPNH